MNELCVGFVRRILNFVLLIVKLVFCFVLHVFDTGGYMFGQMTRRYVYHHLLIDILVANYCIMTS